MATYKSFSQITIYDINDISVSDSPPVAPPGGSLAVGTLWCDSSATPNQLKKWDGDQWVLINDFTEEIEAAKDETLATVEQTYVKQAEYNQTVDGFNWLVSRTGTSGQESSSFEMTSDALNFISNNINLTGKVTFEALDNNDFAPAFEKDETDGKTIINGGRIKANTISADSLNIDSVQAALVTADYINALEIIAGSVAAENITGDTITGKNIEGGTITGGTITGGTITGGTISGATISGGTVSGTKITGGTISGATVSGAKLTTLKTTSDNTGFQLKATTNEFSFESIQDDPYASQFVISRNGIKMNNGGSGKISMYAKTGIELSTGGFGAVTIDGKPVSTSGHTHITLTNSGAVALQAFDGDYTKPDNRAKVRLTVIDSIGYFYPSYNTDGGTSYTQLGGSSHKWRNIYATNGTIQTSDRNMKRDIAELNDKYIELFDGLIPVEYKMLEGDRVHTGFIAQDVEDVMTEVGLTAEDFAGFCRDKKEDSDEYIYGLRYEEFIALAVAKIQRQDKAIKTLEEKIEKLEKKGK